MLHYGFMTSTWKPVLGYENSHEIDTTGNLRRVLMTGVRKPVAPKLTKEGYVSCPLWSCGRVSFRMAHRLLWEAHVAPIPPGMQINHKNGIKGDNRLENLEVDTPSQNTLHKFRVLGHAAPNNPSIGVKNGSAKLDPDKVREIRRLRAQGEYQYVIAKKFGVSQRLVSLIDIGRIWSHVKD